MLKINKQSIMHFYTVDVLKREIRIHKSLNHENIVKLIFYCEDKKNVYLIMEYAGINLLAI